MAVSFSRLSADGRTHFRTFDVKKNTFHTINKTLTQYKALSRKKERLQEKDINTDRTRLSITSLLLLFKKLLVQ